MPAPLPSNETERLAALARYEIIDTLPEEAFDRITILAAEALNVPLAMVNFVDADRQWAKACVGGSADGPREHSFCAWTILEDDVLVVEDAEHDERFKDNPLVLRGPNIRFYAGAPLITPDGWPLGALCVIDHQPRTFSDQDKRFLRRLAAMVVTELELRVRTRELERKVTEYEELSVYTESVAAVVREQEKRNRALIVAFPDVLIRTNADGSLLDLKVPEHAARTLKSADGRARNLAQLFPAGTTALLLRGVQRTLHARAPHSSELQLPFGKDSVDYEARFVPSGQDDVLIILREISERKQVERLKNEFISTVSHELRTPLTSIRGSLSLAVSGVLGELQPRGKKLLEVAYSNTERLMRLINDILDIEKIESGKLEFHFQDAKLNELVERAVEDNQGYAQQYGVTLTAQLEAGSVSVWGDADRLLQVLTNLISNAVKFSPEGGEVIARVEPVDGAWRVTVRDYGPGIPTGFRSRIFQRFAQADSGDARERGGTGLGLSISRAIVERHGGFIGFLDAPGGGSIFYFDLPSHEPQGG